MIKGEGGTNLNKLIYLFNWFGEQHLKIYCIVIQSSKNDYAFLSKVADLINTSKNSLDCLLFCLFSLSRSKKSSLLTPAIPE